MLQWLKNLGAAILGRVVHVEQVAKDHPEAVAQLLNAASVSIPNSTIRTLVGIGLNVVKAHGVNDPSDLNHIQQVASALQTGDTPPPAPLANPPK
jgi:hypothetical protein